MMLPEPWHLTRNSEPSDCEMTSVLDNGWLLESVRNIVAGGEIQLHDCITLQQQKFHVELQ